MARPRSEEARRKALAAATDLIVERGVGNLTIEEVAARSGVAKTTIYRHWPERASLIVDTVRATFEHVGTPDTGSLRGDLEAYFGGMVRADLSGKVGKLMPCLIDAAARDPEIEMLLDRISVERQQPILAIVERAQDRGELPASSTRGSSSARSSARSSSASWCGASRSTRPTSRAASTWSSPAWRHRRPLTPGSVSRAVDDWRRLRVSRRCPPSAVR